MPTNPQPEAHASDAWQPIETFPRTGEMFEVLYGDGGEVERDVYWAEERYCVLGAPQGAYGPGCVSTEAGHLPVKPTHWRPQR